MTVSITHAKVSGQAAGSDPNRIYGTHWDADHTVPVATQAQAEAGTSDAVLVTPENVAQYAANQAYIGASSTVTLTNKTIDLTDNTLTGTIAEFNTALSDANFATIAGTETLTSKTLTSPDINGGTADSLTSFSIRSTGAAFDMSQASSEVLTANRTVSWVLGDAARTITLSGNPTLSDWFDQSVKAAASPTFAGLTVTGAITGGSRNFYAGDGSNNTWFGVTGGSEPGNLGIRIVSDGAGNVISVSLNPGLAGGVTVASGGVATFSSSIELGHASDTTIARTGAGAIAVEGVAVVTISATQTLTNKTIALGSNTVSGTFAELNTAITDGNVANASQDFDWNVFIETVADQDYDIVIDCSFAGTINEITTDCVSGTCTLTGKINTTALGGTANSVSTTETTQAHASANAFVAGDNIRLTISANSSCADMSVKIQYTRALA